MKAEFRTMWQTAGLSLLAAIFTTQAYAQTPVLPEGSQIPGPPCITPRPAWQGGSAPCTAATHREWLADITHWRNERRIRIGFDPSRYDLPRFNGLNIVSCSRR